MTHLPISPIQNGAEVMNHLEIQDCLIDSSTDCDITVASQGPSWPFAMSPLANSSLHWRKKYDFGENFGEKVYILSYLYRLQLNTKPPLFIQAVGSLFPQIFDIIYCPTQCLHLPRRQNICLAHHEISRC